MQGGRKPPGKGREGRRVFRLKAASKTPSVRTQANDAAQENRSDDPSTSAVGLGGAGGASAADTPVSQDSLPRPRPTGPSPSDILLTMEQQLRSGITPTLPTSADDRAGLLASSLVPNDSSGSISNSATLTAHSSSSSGPLPPTPAPTTSLGNSSSSVSSFVVPITPSLTKKRGRVSGRGIVLPGSVGRGGGGAAAPELSFVVVKEWAFSEKKKRGVEVVEKPPFFSELWMMMAAFGDPRGNVTCKCSGHGEKACPCIEGVAAMEKLVKAVGIRMVHVCREWSAPNRIRVKHIWMAMPGEMREYMAWKEAHSKRGTKSEVERGADLRLSDVDDDDDDDDDDEDDDDDDDGDVAYKGGMNIGGNGNGDAPARNKGKGASSAEPNGKIASGGAGAAAIAAPVPLVGGASSGKGAAASGGANADADEAMTGITHGEATPWQKQQILPKNKHRKQKHEEEKRSDGDGGAEAREWAAEEEEVASRIENRKRFADERTVGMEEEDYVKTFFEFRKAFFLKGRCRTNPHADKKKHPPGSRPFLASYLELQDSQEAKDKKLLEALAFMMYDYVGRVIEGAIRKRTGGRLVCNDSDAMLSAEEITAAGAALPPLSGREQRENVRAFRAANPEGIAYNRPLSRFPIGLEHRGDPLRWPRNTIEGGRMLVGGGEVVDTNDKSLAEEAMALFESDFADF
ncbi:unnamed protein product [Ectocarpus sp. 12 AP-2014]